MCTVTIIRVAPPVAPGAPWLRIACNRDELRSRPAALPPDIRRFGERTAVLPIDPLSGGTWIAANDAGLCLTLLNVNPFVRGEGRSAEPQPHRPYSRGEIIPKLLELDSASAALQRAAGLDPLQYPPFRLVLIDEQDIAALRSDGRQMEIDPAKQFSGRPATMFTSSGLGDALVEPPRRALFDAMFGDPSDPIRIQDQFHRHFWRDRRPLSICMSRAEARTVSHTVVEIRPEQVLFRYYPDSPDVEVTSIERRLRRRAADEGR